jgi:hypothetical protein
MWTIHTPGACTLGKESGDAKPVNNTASNTANNETSNGNTRLAINRAFLTLLEQEPVEWQVGKLLLYLVSVMLSWILRSTVVLDTIRCMSTVIGSEFFVEEIIGYGLLGIIATSNNDAYKCAIAMYDNQYKLVRKSNYVPRSKRNKGIIYLWWLELYNVIGVWTRQQLMKVLRYIQPFRKRAIRQLPKRSNKRITQTSMRYNRKFRVGHTLLHHVMTKMTKSTQRVIARCYMNTAEDKSQEIETWDTDSFEVKIDSGCSMSISGDINDFIPGTLKETKGNVSIQSYGGVKIYLCNH